ncbi:hypothetical protein PENANT_c016G08820 [Penicillium antarcticum]|uniref:Mediator of RNA polymerase II transcription subunit 13 n=1 Tax=Penicillium antarcticum TaxID=416450 RepID=A0A1V6Q490_9EURO|nr:uncharacterized protein N7508_001259 [Penicillium antarcticum]KAJ5316751.1 hypothetical protein N7508_001259 [Penicillium antarcticum]OQD83546.1 hypothetical protein PENANT_c016G08820 [Penicillium antarcticum]
MDFPGGANTNIHLIDGFSNIYWRIYTEESRGPNQPQEGPTNGYTILKHLSRLKDLEARLRSLNCLASSPRRLGLWVFSSTPEFESLKPLYLSGEDNNKIVVGTTTLKVGALGSVTALDLVKGLTDNQAQVAQPGQPRPTQGQAPPRRQDGLINSAGIYAAFISAVTGSISLQLIRCHGALPLGSRTLYTAVEKLGYESSHIDNDSIFSNSCLTTLNVQLTLGGTITVSAQTVPQTGIRRLAPRDNVADLLSMQPGIDLWLCPNGTIARLVTANIDAPTASSPGHPTSGDVSAQRLQWKLDVIQWLQNFGLQIGSADEESWVEIEVWEAFYARLAGEAWRQSDDGQSALPLKRMLWPARFCFRRASSSNTTFETQMPLFDDPLDFADRWTSQASSLKLDHSAQNIHFPQERQIKEQEISPSPKADHLESTESLSRIAQYPDLQNTNLVYPTPPDGAAATDMNNPNPSEAFAEDSDFGLPNAPPRDPQRDASGSEPSPGNEIGVGTGRYDASDEEDLFGDMNDRDFGSKGITDADFSFFDDPDFEGMGDEHVEQPQGTIQASQDLSRLEDEPMIDENSSPNLPLEIPNDAETEAYVSPMQKEAPQPNEPISPQGVAHSPTDRTGQTISPPLSPIEIKKILFPEHETNDDRISTDIHGQGHYHPVAFEKKLCDWDQKYGTAGKFWFSGGGPSDIYEQTSAIPTIGLPHRNRTSINTSAAAKERSRAILSLVQTKKGLPSSSVSSSDSDESSDDMAEVMPEHPPTPSVPSLIPSLKRKRAPSDTEPMSVASPEKQLTTTEASPALKVENFTFLGNFLANFSDWTLTGYFSALQSQQTPVLLLREDQLQIAQLLVEQITQSSLKHPLDEQNGPVNLESQSLLQSLDDAEFPGEVSKLDFKRYTSLQDEFTANHPQQQPPQYPMPPKDVLRGFIARLPAPHIRVRRGKEYLEALPFAVNFWETFGLQPAHGPKNISAYCIYPHTASNAADLFLGRLGLLYEEGCSLGTHTRGDDSAGFEKGLKSWQSGSSSYESMMLVLKKMCEELGTELSQSPPTADNCVVYIINPFTHTAALADICSAFWHLFQQLVADSERRQVRPVNELVLQIIPMEFVMSSEALVMPSQEDYLNLALEVYGRCRPKGNDTSPLLCTPPIFLADPLPRAISFRLAPERTSPLQDGRSLHIACSRSLDQRWISVAWSDVAGSIQRTVSYCLKYRQSSGIRPIADVRNEIWATTKHIMEKIQARWKVQLVTTEPMESDEVEAWTSFADQYNKSRPTSLELTILSVNAIPDLILEPPISPISMAVFNPLSTTPVSTPNPNNSIASPEQSGNAATPSSGGPAAYNAPTPTDMSLEPDPDLALTDICDESWLAVLSHRLNSSAHLTDFRPALSSGYLLRRKGPTDSDGVFALTANLIYSARPPPAHDNVLKDTLSMYRDMATLARVKGIRCVQGNTLPWHIATALRAQELLSYTF